ncbi:hypothetical protein DAH55_10775 [Sphingomonas koreensis]|nr:hypothetical protein BDW16_0438 [Sphingomonas koreensis]RSU59577.1 hypothetical protein DAH56_11400 [Sphingomonas koreensis]RSU68730.1 hypothetical protein DAH55_10775 [Sphingomonas koreensis]
MRAYNESRGEKPVAMLFDGWDFIPLDQIRKPVAATELDPPTDQGPGLHRQLAGEDANAV